MFVTLTHLVTLFAFTAHAVMGCCWHHSHAVLGCTSQAAAAVQLADDCTATATATAGCSHQPPAANQSTCGHQHAVMEVDAAQPDAPRLLPAGYCSSSHQPAHHCASGRCSYISAKLLMLDLSEAAALDGCLASYTLLRQLPSVRAHRHLLQWSIFSSPASCGERCAYLQTWQI